MRPTVRVNADTKHLVAIAAIWRSPSLILLGVALLTALVYVPPVLTTVRRNAQEVAAIENQRERRFRACLRNAYQKVGYSLPQTEQYARVYTPCRRWANSFDPTPQR